VALLPNVPRRLLIAVLIAALLMVSVSWVFTRRLTRPLEQLRSRMQTHRPGEPVSGTASHGATPEVVAIELAYAQLLHGLERHERERALMLAGVSHDLRSPLARIRMAASLLPDDPALTARREVIVRNTQVADRLIGSFLDHLRAGELALDERVDLAAIARQVVAATEHDPPKLEVEVPDTLWLSGSSGLLLERLLANLIDNALRHGRAPVRLRIEAQADQTLVEVSDAGEGIPESQRLVVLQAFARGDVSRSQPGTGLGLAIVARVVERMGGTIGFELAEGLHRVQVSLPMRGAGASLPRL
jgi:two-component system osmolarity sensor histidine kinase EnvZ